MKRILERTQQIMNFIKTTKVLAISAISLSTLMASTAYALPSNSAVVKTQKTIPALSWANTYEGKSASDFYMTRLSEEQEFYIPYSKGATTGMRPEIQTYNTKSKKWETKSYARASTTKYPSLLRFTYKFSFIEAASKLQVRIFVPETSKTASFTSTPSTMNFKKNSYTAHQLSKNNKQSVSYGNAITYNLTLPDSIKNLNVQKYDTKTRKWIHSSKLSLVKTTPGKRIYSWKMTHAGTAGIVKYRLQSPSTKTHDEYRSTPLDVNFLKGKGVIENILTPLDTSTLSIKTKDKARFYVNKAANTNVSMQYYDSKKKKWITSSTVKTGNTSNKQIVVINYPKISKTGKYNLRIRLNGTSNIVGTTTKTKTVNYVDQNKYKGVTKQAYDLMKKWCPGVTIGTSKFSSNTIGRAYFPTHQIDIHPNLRGDNLKYVALHECGHILQLQAFNEDANALRERGTQLYGKDSRGIGSEKQADCIAQVLGGSKVVKYSWYMFNKKCSTNELNNAKKIVQGKKA